MSQRQHARLNERDEALVTAAVSSRGLVSFMNRTKWCRLADALEPFGLDVTPEYVDLIDPGNCHDFFGWDYARSDWSAFIMSCRISAVRRERIGALVPDRLTSCEGEVEGILRTLRMPFSRIDGGFEVHGYVDPSRHPDLVDVTGR